MKLSLGIDFGTSGARSTVIDNDRNICWSDSVTYLTQSCIDWSIALWRLLENIPIDQRTQISRIALDGTSGTVILCDATGQPLAEPLMYNDNRGKSALSLLEAIAPTGYQTSATSSLAKLLWYSQQAYFSQAKYLLHQTDWLAFLLHGQLGYSDYHNALKLGYDPVKLAYPAWLPQTFPIVPQILAPGAVVGLVQPEISKKYQFPANCQVCAGTTDSIAAFAAAGASQPGEAVTSLGSTLVLKLVSRVPIDSPQHGVYSHRWGDLWLAGGASNTGGVVLRKFFTDAEIKEISSEIDLQQSCNLDYYPLLQPGERFPINDPDLPPRLIPMPISEADFLQGMLTGIARIEAQGYRLLQELGAEPLTQIYTAGGGSKNATWQTIRQREIGVPIVPAAQQEAAYGAALLALNGGFGFGLGERNR
jgi:D-ribulokinase